MILTIDEARSCLRVSGVDNDVIITSLVEAIPSYLETTTGMLSDQQLVEPLAKTTAKFILQLWYDAVQTDADQLQRTIDVLLKALTVMRTRG